MGISISHLLLVLLVIMIVFGAGKLPKVMGDLAKGIKAFKRGMEEEDEPKRDALSVVHRLSAKEQNQEEPAKNSANDAHSVAESSKERQ